MSVENGETVAELTTLMLQPVKAADSTRSTNDSGYDGNNTPMDKGLHIPIIPFQPLNPILDEKQNVLQSSALMESAPQAINISSIHGTANDFTTRGKCLI